MQKPLQFRISSALKNIIGSDLISDDFIAVFELVKNAYDAHATKVDVIFENIYTDAAKIIIKDNGKGMSFDDIINKWLFVAYSAKKEGTEEDTYNYRDKIRVKRAYAGAKGIGRFSCDRLGEELYLETIKDDSNSTVETLLTEWNKFEGNLKDEFVNISVMHETISKSNYCLQHGTVLEISELKSDWNRSKFLTLKDALAKLINPNTQNSEDEFTINLSVPEELPEDQDKKNYHQIVNGKIQNLIFETLDLKTTKIASKISSIDVKEIETSLYEGGKMVYKIIEENPFLTLHNVKCEIYYLNRSAKLTFSRRMGVQPVEFGHIFIYKNGIRIYPYGERGEDPLRMDNRKAQGRTRYLGTREVIGYISIEEPNDNLRETTSRGDGLLKTKEYFQLIDWFYQNIKRVEKYIIDIVDWGNFLSEDDFIKFNDAFLKGAEEKQEKKDVNENLLKLIETLASTRNIKSVQLAPDIIRILEEKGGASVQKSLKEISANIESESFDKNEVLSKIKTASHRLEKLKKSKEEAEEEALSKLIINEELEVNLEKEKKKGAFQGSLIGTDKERIVGLQHQIYHSSSRISRNLKLLIKHLDPKYLDTRTQKYIKTISLEATKINSIANFVTKANFNLKASEIKTDIIDFAKDYIRELYLVEDRVIDTKMKIHLEDKDGKEYIHSFRPLELTAVIDNIISNAEKAEATQLNIEFLPQQGKLNIIFNDNGKGIPEENISQVFDLGFTTTNGSGIGLFQVRDIVNNSLKGNVQIKSTLKKGSSIKITI